MGSTTPHSSNAVALGRETPRSTRKGAVSSDDSIYCTSIMYYVRLRCYPFTGTCVVHSIEGSM